MYILEENSVSNLSVISFRINIIYNIYNINSERDYREIRCRIIVKQYLGGYEGRKK